MVNCYITGCSSTYASGAINLSGSTTTVTLKDCTITGNHDTDVGGAIDNCGTLILKGKTRIYGNTSTSSNLADDITMGGGGTIDASELTEGSYIGLVYSSNEDRTDLDINGGLVVNNLGNDTTKVAGYFFSDQTGYGLKIVNKTLELRPHTHTWSYAAKDNVITATCAENNPSGVACGAGKVQTLTLDVSKCGKTYDGSAITAAIITASTGWTTANSLLAKPSIYYKGVGDTTYNSSTARPTNTGTYQASITVGGKTATAKFTISPKKIVIPTADTTVYTYTGSEQTYKLAANVGYTVSGNKKTDAGDYTVTATLKDKTNTTWSDGTTADKTYPFTIKKADISVEPTAKTNLTYNGSEQELAAQPADIGVRYIIVLITVHGALIFQRRRMSSIRMVQLQDTE